MTIRGHLGFLMMTVFSVCDNLFFILIIYFPYFFHIFLCLFLSFFLFTAFYSLAFQLLFIFNAISLYCKRVSNCRRRFPSFVDDALFWNGRYTATDSHSCEFFWFLDKNQWMKTKQRKKTHIRNSLIGTKEISLLYRQIHMQSDKQQNI